MGETSSIHPLVGLIILLLISLPSFLIGCLWYRAIDSSTQRFCQSIFTLSISGGAVLIWGYLNGLLWASLLTPFCHSFEPPFFGLIVSLTAALAGFVFYGILQRELWYSR